LQDSAIGCLGGLPRGDTGFRVGCRRDAHEPLLAARRIAFRGCLNLNFYLGFDLAVVNLSLHPLESPFYSFA
jgi:hypothetical protein